MVIIHGPSNDVRAMWVAVQPSSVTWESILGGSIVPDATWIELDVKHVSQ